MLIIVTVLIVVILVIVFNYFKRKHYVDLGNKFPGPRTIPLLSNGHVFLNRSSEDIFAKIIELHKKYGDTFRLWFGPDLWIVETDPKQIEAILNNATIKHKSSDYKFFEPWLGKGLLISAGSKWHKRRKIITPAFHFKILEQFLNIFNSQTDILVEKLKQYVKQTNGSLDIVPIIKLCTLDIICETALGTKINAQIQSNTDYLKAVQKASEIIHHRSFDALAQNDVYFSMTRNSRIFQKCIVTLHNFTESVIIKRRENLMKLKSNNRVSTFDFDECGPKKKMTLLDILLQSTIDGRSMTNEEIREELDTFMFAGHETTTCAISFLLYNFAKNQECQQKAYEEIVDICGTSLNTALTSKQISGLKYLDLAAKESLRMFPPTPMIGRRILQDIDINGRIYPASANISIGIYHLHNNPKIYPEPDKFIPERFDFEATSRDFNPYSYIPFSAGPRVCIGQKYALLEMKVFIAKLLRNFKFNLEDPDEKLVLLSEIVLKSKNGIQLVLEKRT